MRFFASFILLIFSLGIQAQIKIISDQDSPRIKFGAEKLREALASGGMLQENKNNRGEHLIYIGIRGSAWWKKNIDPEARREVPESKEGFRIYSEGQNIYAIGYDASGGLYAAMELVDRIKENKILPEEIDFSDKPEMVLRGTAIGMQKTTLLPGRGVYEYPYTPENFPWFYDKELWIRYLDMLVENRYNSLYLWNGHPFASLVKLKDYPFAMEVSEETFRKNEEIFNFITKEADKRGIWIIQMFYNIIVSKPFAEHYGIKTQDRGREITPLLEDYTRKSISAFIVKYPNVGLLVALGEAMSGIENDIDWFTNTIIPGVKDGMKKLGRTDEPPIILRAHDTDASKVIKEAFPLYKNLYTMNKYTGESLTTYQPRGPWTKIHQELSHLASIHISNVHILANLEPFRYGSPYFIQKSVQAMHNIHGANALHLYPQASYWDWPYSADKTDERLLEMDRDWIWYEAWGRYSWNDERDRKKEVDFWSNEIANKYGTSKASGEKIMEAYDQAGEIAPKTLRRFGITEGNRQTLLLGMFMSQLVNPYKWRVYPGFYESTGPKGEILIEYAEKEWKKEPHVGETPPQIIREIVAHGRKAVAAIDEVAPDVTKNEEEFKRLQNDMHAYKAFANFFSEKVKAALLVLEYDHSGNLETLKKAVPHLKESLGYYRKLVELTKNCYLYANSMQTGMRRIPIGGNDGKYKTWEEMLPLYEKEYKNFRENLSKLEKSGGGPVKRNRVEPWIKANVEVVSDKENYPIATGKLVYDKMSAQIIDLAPELSDLQGVKYSEKEQIENGTSLKFKNETPVKVVVGFFDSKDSNNLIAPTLETNAAGNVRGQADIILANALKLDEYPTINVHTYLFEAGSNELKLGKGRVLILGLAQELIDPPAAVVGTRSYRDVADSGAAGQDRRQRDFNPPRKRRRRQPRQEGVELGEPFARCGRCRGSRGSRSLARRVGRSVADPATCSVTGRGTVLGTDFHLLAVGRQQEFGFRPGIDGGFAGDHIGIVGAAEFHPVFADPEPLVVGLEIATRHHRRRRAALFAGSLEILQDEHAVIARLGLGDLCRALGFEHDRRVVGQDAGAQTDRTVLGAAGRDIEAAVPALEFAVPSIRQGPTERLGRDRRVDVARRMLAAVLGIDDGDVGIGDGDLLENHRLARSSRTGAQRPVERAVGHDPHGHRRMLDPHVEDRTSPLRNGASSASMENRLDGHRSARASVRRRRHRRRSRRETAAAAHRHRRAP